MDKLRRNHTLKSYNFNIPFIKSALRGSSYKSEKLYSYTISITLKLYNGKVYILYLFAAYKSQ